MVVARSLPGVEELLESVAAYLPTDRAEAEFVVHAIERMIGGSTFFSLDSGRVEHAGESSLCFADFAVLYRTEHQAEVLQEAGFSKQGPSKA